MIEELIEEDKDGQKLTNNQTRLSSLPSKSNSTKIIAILIGLRSAELSLEEAKRDIGNTKLDDDIYRYVKFHRNRFGFFWFTVNFSYIIKEMKFPSMSLEHIEVILKYLDTDFFNIHIDLQNLPNGSPILDIIRNTCKKSFEYNSNKFRLKISSENRCFH